MKKYFSILLKPIMFKNLRIRLIAIGFLTMLVLLSLNACGKASETKNSNNNNDTSSFNSSVSDDTQAVADSSLSSDAAAIASGDIQQAQDNNASSPSGTENNSAADTAGSNASSAKNNDSSTTAAADVKSASAAARSSSGSSSSKAAASSAASSKPTSSAASSSKPASGGSSSSKSSSAGNMGSFTMTDLNGNTANQSIFNNYTLTMVNVWATYCNPCIKEIPGISDVYNQVKSKGVNIIGVVSDGPGKLDTVKELVNKTGAGYKMYIPSSSMLQNSFMSNLSFVPTTFFVDRNGNRVGSPVSGSKTADQWLSTINDMLSRVS